MQDFIFGYGSLMSHDSRYRYSDIDSVGVAATISGWHRAWNMACAIENFTCVGVLAQTSAVEVRGGMNGKLFPVPEISENLKQREQNYRFRQIPLAQLYCWQEERAFPWSDDAQVRVWICELRNAGQSSPAQPIYQSYVDTCIAGCLEDVGEEFARQFILTTRGWEGYWVNDRNDNQYPRAARVSESMQEQIDQLLMEADVLRYRREE